MHLIDAPLDVLLHIILRGLGGDEDLLCGFAFPRDEFEAVGRARGTEREREVLSGPPGDCYSPWCYRVPVGQPGSQSLQHWLQTRGDRRVVVNESRDRQGFRGVHCRQLDSRK